MSKIINKLYHTAQLEPNKIAFYASDVASGKERVITYGELAAEVKRVAECLISQHVSCLAIELENSYEWLVSDLAALASGIACLPVPMFFTEQQKEHLFNSVRVDAIVSAENEVTQGNVVAELSSGICISRLEPVSKTNVLKGTCKVTFTSGSTGTPKGVCLSREHLDKVTVSLANVLPEFSADDKHLVMLPLSTLLENITGIYVPIIAGSASTIMNGARVGLNGSSQFDIQRFSQCLADIKPATLVLTPALLAALVTVAAQDSDYVNSLKFIAVGGAKAPLPILNQAKVLGLPVYEGYGLSECASVVSVNSPESSAVGTVGRPLLHHQVKIASDGEILVSPPGFLGYLEEPFSDDWYPTGDIGQWTHDGYLEIIGRKKNIVVTSFGRNISPEWIETQAYQWPELRNLIFAGEIDCDLCVLSVSSEPESVIAAVSELNTTLPDYARIKTVVVVADPRLVSSLYTQNFRPVRTEIYKQIHEWMLMPEAQRMGVLIKKISNS